MVFSFYFFFDIAQNNIKKIMETEMGLKLKQFHNFGSLIDQFKDLRPNLKHGIHFGLFM